MRRFVLVLLVLGLPLLGCGDKGPQDKIPTPEELRPAPDRLPVSTDGGKPPGTEPKRQPKPTAQ